MTNAKRDEADDNEAYLQWTINMKSWKGTIITIHTIQNNYYNFAGLAAELSNKAYRVA